MRIDFFCCNCLTQRELDVHGKCDVCGSRQTYYYPADVEPVYIPSRPTSIVNGNLACIAAGLFLLACAYGAWFFAAGFQH